MSTNLSRRKLLTTGSVALLASAALGKNEPALAEMKSFTRSDREVSVISGGDASFREAVEASYRGLMDDPVFQKISPLAILLSHKGGPGIIAHSISWTIATPSGTYKTPLFSYVSPGSPKTGHSPFTLGSARKDVLSSGQSRLITPFFSWTSRYYQNNPEPDWKVILQPTDPGAFLVSQLPTATAVNVSLDAAIFSDWKIMGPDEHHLSRKLRTRRHAEHDEAVKIRFLLKAGASDAVIRDALLAHANKLRSSCREDGWRWYFQARIYQAQILLRHFENSDRDTFAKAVIRLTREPRTVITRLDA